MRNRFPRNCRVQLGSLENVVLLTGDRKFESISLQRRVGCELDFLDHGWRQRARIPKRMCGFSA
jgi:hypothetical protein